jgi:hypothetical protein
VDTPIRISKRPNSILLSALLLLLLVLVLHRFLLGFTPVWVDLLVGSVAGIVWLTLKLRERASLSATSEGKGDAL